MSKFKFVQWYGIVVCLLMAACTDVDITMPKGPKGDTGLSAYEFWKEKVADGTVDWPKDQTEVADFFKYLKGNDGKDGKDGKSAFDQWKDMIADGSVDNPHNPGSKWPAGNNTVQDFWYFLTGATGESGQTPHIGDNGHWFVGNEDTGIAAQGEAGKDGANGKDAVPPTVTIGDNDHWFVNGVDTGKKATGTNGKDGVSPTITIGNNGNWFVDGTDTGKKPLVPTGNLRRWPLARTVTGISMVRIPESRLSVKPVRMVQTEQMVQTAQMVRTERAPMNFGKNTSHPVKWTILINPTRNGQQTGTSRRTSGIS